MIGGSIKRKTGGLRSQPLDKFLIRLTPQHSA